MDTPWLTVVGLTIAILKLSSTSMVPLQHSDACIHQPLVMDRPKAFLPIHWANSSSRVMFINSDMALRTSNELWRQMAQRRIRYCWPRIWLGQSTSYLPSCTGTLTNAWLFCERWHLGQMSSDWGMDLQQSDLRCGPKHLKHRRPSSNNGQFWLGWWTFPSPP
jgi:hypothetical protein